MNNWDESKHPRDNDGKFTSGGGTPAEQKRLEEMGIISKSNDEPLLSAEEQKLRDMGIEVDRVNKNGYNSIKPRKLSEFKALKKILDSENLDELIQRSHISLFNKGREDLILKPIIEEIGFDGLPQKVSASKFEELKKSNQVLYRGLTDKKYVDAYCNGEMFLGLGVNGTGIYTTINEQKAKDYAKENGVIVEMLIDKKAKIANGIELAKEAKEMLFSLQEGTDITGKAINLGLDNNKLFKIGDGTNKRLVTLLALSKGYDAIEVGNGDYIVLNRTATIIKEK